MRLLTILFFVWCAMPLQAQTITFDLKTGESLDVITSDKYGAITITLGPKEGKLRVYNIQGLNEDLKYIWNNTLKVPTDFHDIYSHTTHKNHIYWGAISEKRNEILVADINVTNGEINVTSIPIATDNIWLRMKANDRQLLLAYFQGTTPEATVYNLENKTSQKISYTGDLPRCELMQLHNIADTAACIVSSCWNVSKVSCFGQITYTSGITVPLTIDNSTNPKLRPISSAIIETEPGKHLMFGSFTDGKRRFDDGLFFAQFENGNQVSLKYYPWDKVDGALSQIIMLTQDAHKYDITLHSLENLMFNKNNLFKLNGVFSPVYRVGDKYMVLVEYFQQETKTYYNSQTMKSKEVVIGYSGWKNVLYFFNKNGELLQVEHLPSTIGLRPHATSDAKILTKENGNIEIHIAVFGQYIAHEIIPGDDVKVRQLHKYGREDKKYDKYYRDLKTVHWHDNITLHWDKRKVGDNYVYVLEKRTH